MKKVLILLAMALCGTTLASAAVINVTCNPNPAAYLGQSGGGVESCLASQIPGGEVVVGATIQYVFDFQFDEFNNGTKSVDFSFDNSVGAAYDWAIVGATDATTPMLSPLFNVAPGDFAAIVAGFSVTDSYTGASTAITGATFSKNIVITTRDPTIPEPSTWGLLGLGLAFLGLRRRRKQ